MRIIGRGGFKPPRRARRFAPDCGAAARGLVERPRRTRFHSPRRSSRESSQSANGRGRGHDGMPRQRRADIAGAGNAGQRGESRSRSSPCSRNPLGDLRALLDELRDQVAQKSSPPSCASASNASGVTMARAGAGTNEQAHDLRRASSELGLGLAQRVVDRRQQGLGRDRLGQAGRKARLGAFALALGTGVGRERQNRRANGNPAGRTDRAGRRRDRRSWGG